jgi:hypothetical protein
LPRLLERRAGDPVAAGALFHDGFGQRPRRIPDLVLEILVLIERVVAGRVGLPVPDIAVELCRGNRRARAS